jgi:pimeloyl-ACP methyl ester carboxylesterase
MSQSNQIRPMNIVLIHGMWMTPRSWAPWVERLERAGHRVLAPSWPGLEVEVEALRADPTPLKTLGVGEIVEHYAKIIEGLDEAPLLIGHSYGGALVQLLLDRGLGAAGVALSSAPVKGVYWLPPSTLRIMTPLLLNPFNASKPLPLSAAGFHYAFGNTLSREASDEVYARLHIPAAGRALFQGALANLAPSSPLKVNFKNNERAPLLIVSGELDQILPPSIQQENVRRYAGSTAKTEYKLYEARSHYIAGEPGWEQVADELVAWGVANARAAH